MQDVKIEYKNKKTWNAMIDLWLCVHRDRARDHVDV